MKGQESEAEDSRRKKTEGSETEVHESREGMQRDISL